jgi:hypothetical protein
MPSRVYVRALLAAPLTEEYARCESINMIDKNQTLLGVEKRIGKRLLLGPFSEWSIENAIRYMPIVRTMRRYGFMDQVTEIGSGSLGITPHLRRSVVGVDLRFDGPPHPLLHRVEASALDLPFKSASLPCVVSTDMLEHIASEARSRAVSELIRVTRNVLVLAVPVGERAESHDRELRDYYRTWNGEDYPFLSEHVENGLPSAEQVVHLIKRGIEESNRRASVHYVKNSNLRVRRAIMRTWIRTRRRADRIVWQALNYLHPLLSRANFGACYRLIIFIKFR